MKISTRNLSDSSRIRGFLRALTIEIRPFRACTISQVLKYVPVMARPLVLGRWDHPTIWTPVYADISDPKMTDWLWEQRENEEQRERFLIYYRTKLNTEEQDKRFVKKPKRWPDRNNDLQGYKLMTSVSMPVFDRRENAVRISPFALFRAVVTPREMRRKFWPFIRPFSCASREQREGSIQLIRSLLPLPLGERNVNFLSPTIVGSSVRFSLAFVVASLLPVRALLLIVATRYLFARERTSCTMIDAIACAESGKGG